MKFLSAGLLAATSTSLTVLALHDSPEPNAAASTLTVTSAVASNKSLSGLTVNGGAGSRIVTFLAPNPTSLDSNIPGSAGGFPIALSIGSRASSQSSATTLVVSSPAPGAAATNPFLRAAAVVSDEPAYDDNHASTLVYQDNMESYTTAVAMGALTGTGPRLIPIPSPIADGNPVDALVQVIAGGRDGTGKALRLAYDGQAQTALNFATTNTPATATLATHYFQYYARVTFSGTPAGAVAVKWFEAFHATNGRVQWNTHDHLPCAANSINTYWQVIDQAATTCQGNQPVGPYFANITNQGWHRYTYAYRPNTSAGSRDGIARMWVDGVKVIDISAATIGVTPPFGEKPWCLGDDVDGLANSLGVSFIRFGSAQTTVTPSWSYDIDDLLWWTA